MRNAAIGWLVRWRWQLAGCYLLLLLGSHWYLATAGREEVHLDPTKKSVQMGAHRLAYLEWGAEHTELPPLILLHGSPWSGADDWEDLGRELARQGRRVIAVDRLGFGASSRWVGDYSFEADRRSILQLMDTLGIARAHVGGWSYGGAPALLLAAKDSDRVLSVSLIAAIGIQEGEGSGNYHLEHIKYGTLHILANWFSHTVPHFGSIGSPSFRNTFSRDFLDSDQRPIASHLRTMTPPLLVVHGKDDPLIGAWVAERHHALHSQSRLVLLSGSHFLPFRSAGDGNFTVLREEMLAFLNQADRDPGLIAGVRNETDRDEMRALWPNGPKARGYKPWWAVVLVGATVAWFLPRTSGFLFGLAGGLLIVDLLTILSGVVVATSLRQRRLSLARRLGRAGIVFLCGLMGGMVGVKVLSGL